MGRSYAALTEINSESHQDLTLFLTKTDSCRSASHENLMMIS